MKGTCDGCDKPRRDLQGNEVLFCFICRVEERRGRIYKYMRDDRGRVIPDSGRYVRIGESA